MAARWWCQSYLRTSVTASSSPWSLTSWTLWTRSCRGRRAQVHMTASLSPSNCHQVGEGLLMLAGWMRWFQRGRALHLWSLVNLFFTWTSWTRLKLQSPSSGVSNEARFVFTVQSIVMSQKLKGTLTFIVKVCSHTDTHHFSWWVVLCIDSTFVQLTCVTLPFRLTKEDELSFHLFVSTEWRLLDSWETGLQTALYLHLVPNHYSVLQVGVSVLCGPTIPNTVKTHQQ